MFPACVDGGALELPPSNRSFVATIACVSAPGREGGGEEGEREGEGGSGGRE